MMEGLQRGPPRLQGHVRLQRPPPPRGPEGGGGFGPGLQRLGSNLH